MGKGEGATVQPTGMNFHAEEERLHAAAIAEPLDPFAMAVSILCTGPRPHTPARATRDMPTHLLHHRNLHPLDSTPPSSLLMYIYIHAWPLSACSATTDSFFALNILTAFPHLATPATFDFSVIPGLQAPIKCPKRIPTDNLSTVVGLSAHNSYRPRQGAMRTGRSHMPPIAVNL